MKRPDPDGSQSRSCPDAAALEAYHRAKMAETLGARIHEHVRGCKLCQAALQELQKGEEWAELLREARREIPPNLRERLVDSATTVTRDHENPSPGADA